MEKHKYTQEFDFKTSPKVLFNYISTPGGLQQWFASKVTLDSDNKYHFFWDEDEHVAEMTSNRLNKSTKFEFVGKDEGSFLEFKLIISEIDNATYLKITDCSDNEDEEDLEYLWKGLILDLKDIVGG